jgi:diguanylate cyclase (GGDEF)-like protein
MSNVVKSHSKMVETGRPGLKDPYARQHVRMVSSLVRFIGTVTEELEKANQELEVPVTDRLTRLYNRARIEVVLDKEADRVRRYGESLSVIMLDVDHFKRVNDEHGHDVGDAVLVILARILQESLRSSDTVGRWGGEEFMIILPQTGSAQAMEVAEKIRVAVATAIFPVVTHKTASFGVATYQPMESVANLLVRADQALYAAHGGRNRIELAEAVLERMAA